MNQQLINKFNQYLATNYFLVSNFLFFFMAWLLIPGHPENDDVYNLYLQFTPFDYAWALKAEDPFFKTLTFFGFEVINLFWAIFFLVFDPSWMKTMDCYKNPKIKQLIILPLLALVMIFPLPQLSLCPDCWLSWRWFYAICAFTGPFMLVLFTSILHRKIFGDK